jgi:putative phosphonate metabolism protein
MRAPQSWQNRLMTEFQRFAIYHAPRDPGLAKAGAQWLGWDAVNGIASPHPTLDALPRPLAELTETPRKYGFHATIKAPFALAAGVTHDDLAAALAGLAQDVAPVDLAGLEVAALGNFLALRPVGDVTALQAMVARVVEGLEGLRAPLTPAQIAKRDPDSLSARQRDLLTRFGYPYVFEQYQMHMTLSGALGEADRATLLPIAQAYFTPHLTRPYPMDDLCLFGEARDGRFHLIHRYALTA